MSTSVATSSKSAQASRRLEPGSLLQDTYRIDHVIASGGMGEVYRATHERLEGAFAIKMLHPELLNEEGLLARFETEAKIMASLHHPNIVQVFDFNLTPSGTPYLVMELAEGQDLRTIMTEQRVLSPYRVSQIVEQTASALGAAHAHGIVHRDLKPENVMLVPIDSQAVCVKVVDFGVSKTSRRAGITIESTVIGTPEYMSPEQAQGLNDEVDARTDQFALATMAYGLLSGTEPFRGQTPVAVLYQVVHEQPKALAHLVDWPCARIQAVLQKAMAKNREDRYPTIVDFARAFTEAVAADLSGDPQSGRTTPLPLKTQPAVGRSRGRLSSEIDVNLAVPLGEDDTAVVRPLARRSEQRPQAQAQRRVSSPRDRAPARSWRLALMTFGAACLAAATLALGASGPGPFTLNSDRVISVYDSLSTSATKILHLGNALKIPEATE